MSRESLCDLLSASKVGRSYAASLVAGNEDLAGQDAGVGGQSLGPTNAAHAAAALFQSTWNMRVSEASLRVGAACPSAKWSSMMMMARPSAMMF